MTSSLNGARSRQAGEENEVAGEEEDEEDEEEVSDEEERRRWKRDHRRRPTESRGRRGAGVKPRQVQAAREGGLPLPPAWTSRGAAGRRRPSRASASRNAARSASWSRYDADGTTFAH